MIKFFREDGLAEHFKAMRRDDRTAMIAVPFWGEGAAAMLGLDDGGGTRVLCRLDSPGCNPRALRELVDAGVKIRSHPRLHAKIYATKGCVIVGSSNASRYGLTEDGDVVSGSIEANVLTDDAGVIADALNLFERLWVAKETSKVTASRIMKEIDRRDAQPFAVAARQLNSLTLLAACREAPELFGSVHLVAYDEELCGRGLTALNDLKRDLVSGETSDASAFRHAWGYQLEELLPGGAWLIDLDCRRKTPKVWGASQVPMPTLRLKAKGEDDVTVTVRGVVTVPGAQGRFRMSAAEKELLVRHAKRLLQRKGGVMPLPEAVRVMDKRERGTTV